MRSQKTITKCSILSFTPAVTCCMCLDLVKGLLIWYSLKVDKTATQLHCQGASHLVRSAICDRSTCKSFRVPPFTLLHELYNSVYYSYVIITQRLVGWFWGQGKKGVCIDKKNCTVAPRFVLYTLEPLYCGDHALGLAIRPL